MTDSAKRWLRRGLAGGALASALVAGWAAQDLAPRARCLLAGPRSYREALALKDCGGAALPLSTLTAIRSQSNMAIWDMLALGYAESKGDPTAVSSTGALGWLQIDPSHAKARKIDPQRLFDPRTNARVGSEVWCDCKESGRSDFEALVLWNNGYTAGKKILQGVDPLPGGTVKLYIRFERKQRAYREWIERGRPLR